MKIKDAYARTETSGRNGAGKIIGVVVIEFDNKWEPCYEVDDDGERSYIPVSEVQVVIRSHGHDADPDILNGLSKVVDYRGG